MNEISQALSVIEFWFEEIEPRQWYKKDAAFDAHIAERFGALVEKASRGEYWHWRKDAKGRLAEIIVLDQLSRNIFRGQGRAFAQDSMALVLAQEAVSNKVLEQLPAKQRAFVLMPFMHSESLTVHQQAERLFHDPKLENTLRFEIRHRDIIERFGRYPYRNDALGRQSSEEEIAFLRKPGSSF